MKKLITFNNFSIQPIHENWNDNDYFKLKSMDETDNLMEKMIDVTDEDLNVVTSCLNSEKYDIKISTWRILQEPDGPVTNLDRVTTIAQAAKIIICKYILATRVLGTLKIFRLPDEWYLVIPYPYKFSFLCDQLDGLKYFINKAKQEKLLPSSDNWGQKNF